MSSGRKLIVFFSSFFFLADLGARALAETRTIGFENPPYTTGSIDGQDGWGGPGGT